jgi:endonuclease/exonuclease/phosphatase family metal-dependent hydrolase
MRVLLVAAGIALIMLASGCHQPPAPAAAQPGPPGSRYTLMQMNLCLSGLAGCYGKVRYPAVVREAESRIREAGPNAVTFNEACRGDIAQIARQTGYRMRFANVIYRGSPLPCVRPGGRGLFGDAVLTKAAIANSRSEAFRAQAGPERRVWLCVSTRGGITVCTAHLASPDPAEAAANDPQCTELATVLTRQAVGHPAIFGGDVNRRSSCAPPSFWAQTDASGHQDPGSQQAYGSAAFHHPSAQVVPAAHTDHDVLLVRASVRTLR